jgi:hypothetical protein
VEGKTWKLELRDLGSYYRLRRKLSSDAYVRWIERAVERILGEDFEFVELQTGERDPLDRLLLLKLSQDLPIGTLPQVELIRVIPKTNGYDSFPIDGAVSKDGERG